MTIRPLPLLNALRNRGIKQGDPFREKGTQNIRYFWNERYDSNPKPPSITTTFGEDYLIELSHASDRPLQLFGMPINSFDALYERVTPTILEADQLPDG